MAIAVDTNPTVSKASRKRRRSKAIDSGGGGVNARHQSTRHARAAMRQTPNLAGIDRGVRRISGSGGARSAADPACVRCTRGELLEARPLVMATNVLTTRDFSRSPVESPLRVLVVDDEPLIRWSVAETLGERGFEVVETGDALATRVAVRADPSFDVVLLDYRLPDSDDLSLLASI